MELEEMKTAWRELDERLAKQEVLGANFIRDSIAARSQRSANKFLAAEMIGVVVILALIPLLIAWICNPNIVGIPLMKAFFVSALTLDTIILVWQLVKVCALMRIDMEGPARDNIKWVRRYRLYVLWEKRVMYFLMPLLFIWSFVLYAAQKPLPPWVWAFMVCVYVMGVLCLCYYYRRFYARNMAAIKKGLEELIDL